MRFYMKVFVLLTLFLSATFLTFDAKPVRANVQEIAAVVNEGAISARDLDKRMKLIMASSGLPNNKEIRSKLVPQILGSLINEQLMLQEANKMGVKIEHAEIEQGFEQVAAQNNTKPDKFKAMLKRSGVDISTMYAQIEAQIAWSKVVQARLRPRVVVSERDVDDALERIRAKIGTKEYLTAEIFLPVNDAKKQGQVRQLANRLVREIRSGKASFFKLAQQFSKAAGSSSGGDTGWVQETQMSEEILAGVQAIKKNQVTSPIKSQNGYHVLFLRDVRTLTEDTMPSRDQVFFTLGTERLEKLQRRHLMDLRAASFVDIRV